MSKFSRLIAKATDALERKTGSTGAQGSSDWQGMVRRAADAFTGEQRDDRRPDDGGRSVRGPAASPTSAEDRAAIARYDYLMRTADPQSVEQIHRDAFERLTPDQRAQIQARMTDELPAHERPVSSSPTDLARAAGRTEAARPGRMRGILSRIGGGAAAGAGIGILGAVAGGAVLSTVAVPLLAEAAQFGVDFHALADSVDLGGMTDTASGVVADAGEQVSGIADQATAWGEQASSFELPNLRDIFGG